MENKKTIIVAGIGGLIVIGGLGLCAILSFVAVLPIFRGNQEKESTLPERTGVTRTIPHPEAATGSPTAIPSPTVEFSPTGTITPAKPTGLMSTDVETPSSTPEETSGAEPGLTYAPSPTVGPLALDPWCVPWNTESIRGQVRAVIDGVTIEVMVNGEVFLVHYIGIEIPDYSGDLSIWTRAAERNRELVEGKMVLLVKDRSEVDGEGRRLRYVMAGSVFVNRQLVESGYAVAASSPPDISCDGLFQEAETLARAAGRGLWASTPTPTRTPPTPTPTPLRTGKVIIARVSWKGTMWQEPEEYVEIFNDGDLPVQLQDWTLRDLEKHVFAFPNFVLGPGQYCRVYTDQYRPDNCGFTYGSPSPIWENDGDCAFLKDGEGVLIDLYCYE